MRAYYNELDPYCAQWLRNLINAGHIPPGDVDERSITEVKADEIKGYDQWHFFAGLGGWGYAARLAGIGEASGILTGSPPCQPFSTAGKRQGYADERHLAPVWLDLVAALRPAWVFGEQVAAAIKKDDWLDDLLDALEREGYATGAAVLPACGVGAPHIRQRLWVVARLANADALRRERERRSGTAQSERVAKCQQVGGLEKPSNSRAGHQRREVGEQRRDALEGRSTCLRQGDRAFMPDRRHANGESSGLAQSDSTRSQPRREAAKATGHRNTADAESGANRHEPAHASVAGWDDPDWLFCRDGKWRPAESGTFPLADGIPARVGRLRAYGNAIVPQVAAEIIKAAMEGMQMTRKWHGGKGDSRRKGSDDAYRRGWDRVFGKRDKPKESRDE